MDAPTGRVAGLAQDLLQPLTVLVVLADRLTMVAPIHDVAEGTPILSSQFAWHKQDHAGIAALCQ